MSFRFDPRNLIHGPFIECPSCGASREFGVLMINTRSYVRRCRECWHALSYPLPELKKKVLYLDQFALSQMMKALNPAAKSHGKDPLHTFWVDLFQRLDRLCKLQMLVCPRSEFHTDESLISPFPTPLKRMYEQLSGGVSFLSRHELECKQLGEASGQWSAGVFPPVPGIDRQRVLRGDLCGWRDRLIISVNWSEVDMWADGVRSHRQQMHKGLAELFDSWRTQKPTFNEVFQNECLHYGRAIINRYREHLTALAASYEGNAPDNIADLISTPNAHKIQYVRDALERCGTDRNQSLKRALEFLMSPAVQHVPHARIAATLLAALARRVVAGMKKPPNEGTETDVLAISTVMPYCDAMLVDNEFASILREDDVAHKLNFGTRVFSTKNRQELLAYLDEVEATVTPEYRAKVTEVYGTDWPTPFTTMYTYGKEPSEQQE